MTISMKVAQQYLHLFLNKLTTIILVPKERSTVLRKRKKWNTLLILIGIAIGCFALTYIPHKMITISPSEVSSIEVFNGSTGDSLTITDKEDIKHIITNLNQITFQKSKCSLFYMGYCFNITIYKNNAKVYENLIINSENTIRDDPFFYRDKTNSIDFDYIEKLFDANK